MLANCVYRRTFYNFIQYIIPPLYFHTISRVLYMLQQRLPTSIENLFIPLNIGCIWNVSNKHYCIKALNKLNFSKCPTIKKKCSQIEIKTKMRGGKNAFIHALITGRIESKQIEMICIGLWRIACVRCVVRKWYLWLDNIVNDRCTKTNRRIDKEIDRQTYRQIFIKY